MVDREDIGSWLQGPRSRNPDVQPPGVRLGLPIDGPGSVAGFGRRFVAVVLDFLLCELIATLFGFRFGHTTGDVRDFIPLMVFAVENILLVGTVGSTIGQRLLGLRVQRLSGGLPGPALAAVRTLLLCLVVPALIWDRDQRGVHDRIPGTVLVRI
jgi:uncharacterized RDD family membrane protein YckC